MPCWTLGAGCFLFIIYYTRYTHTQNQSRSATLTKALSLTGVSSISMTFWLNTAQSSWLSLLCHQQHTSSTRIALRCCCLSIFSKQHRWDKQASGYRREPNQRSGRVIYSAKVEDNWWEDEEKARRWILTSVVRVITWHDLLNFLNPNFTPHIFTVSVWFSHKNFSKQCPLPVSRQNPNERRDESLATSLRAAVRNL